MTPIRQGQSRLELRGLIVTALAMGFAATSERPLVDAIVVGGLGVVAPLALGPSRWWTLGAACAAVALGLEPGPIATALALPALVAAGWSLRTTIRHLGIRLDTAALRATLSLTTIAVLIAPVWAIAAVLSLMASTAGLGLFDIGEPIVRLTAVHYLYAGVGALVIAQRLLSAHRPSRLAVLAVVASGAAPPIVAVGFVLDHPAPQIGGAVMMTLGVWSSAALLLIGVGSSRRPRSWLRLVAGLTPWVPMALAVAWASAQHFVGVAALSIPDMARVHGLMNGIGFVLIGLFATGPRLPVGLGHELAGAAA